MRVETTVTIGRRDGEGVQVYWRIQIQLTDTEWVTMAPYYRSRKTAQGWLSFVKAAWHARHGRTVAVTIGGDTDARHNP